MKQRTPLFLTKNRAGNWQYQRWLPARFVSRCPTLKKIFRVSLGTSDKKLATRLARKITVKIDDLIIRYFDRPEDFARAMELLYRSIKTANECGDDFPCYEEGFLMDLDPSTSDEIFLTKGEKFAGDIQRKIDSLKEEISFLKQAVSGAVDPDNLLAQIEEKINPKIPDSENPTLKQVFEEWKAANQPTMVKASFEEYCRMIGLFIRIIEDFSGGDTRIADLSRDSIKYYHDVFKKIPSRVKTDSYTVAELVALSGRPKSPTTIKNTYTNLTHFLKFVHLQYPIFDIDLVGYMTAGDRVKITEKQKIIVSPFSDYDLKRIFESEKYRNGTIKQSGMYWAALIALFTGARLSEILQLEKTDVKKEGKIWYFNFDDSFSDDEQKRLKAAGSKRTVPIHKQLISLGFIDYVQHVEGRIFPDEPRNAKGKFDAFQKRFANYLKSCRVHPDHNRERKSFHSFRHTVRTRLAEIGKTGRASERFGDGIVDAIVGHQSRDRSIGQKNYTHSDFLKVKNRAINRLQYDVDFSVISDWKHCRFVKYIK